MRFALSASWCIYPFTQRIYGSLICLLVPCWKPVVMHSCLAQLDACNNIQAGLIQGG